MRRSIAQETNIPMREVVRKEGVGRLGSGRGRGEEKREWREGGVKIGGGEGDW